jgi:hypothetical protein
MLAWVYPKQTNISYDLQGKDFTPVSNALQVRFQRESGVFQVTSPQRARSSFGTVETDRGGRTSTRSSENIQAAGISSIVPAPHVLDPHSVCRHASWPLRVGVQRFLLELLGRLAAFQPHQHFGNCTRQSTVRGLWRSSHRSIPSWQSTLPFFNWLWQTPNSRVGHP